MSKLAELLGKGKPGSSPAPPLTPPVSAALPVPTVFVRSGLTLNKLANVSLPVLPAGVAAVADVAGFGRPLTTQTPATQVLSVVEAELANMEISLQNDVTDWPITAYADIDTDTVEGKLKAMLNEVQRVLLTDDVSTVMHRTMQFLHENPALTDTLLPDDIGLLVTALESSYGVVINTKTENRAKKSKSGAVASDLANAFADLQF